MAENTHTAESEDLNLIFYDWGLFRDKIELHPTPGNVFFTIACADNIPNIEIARVRLWEETGVDSSVSITELGYWRFDITSSQPNESKNRVLLSC